MEDGGRSAWMATALFEMLFSGFQVWVSLTSLGMNLTAVWSQPKRLNYPTQGWMCIVKDYHYIAACYQECGYRRQICQLSVFEFASAFFPNYTLHRLFSVYPQLCSQSFSIDDQEPFKRVEQLRVNVPYGARIEFFA